MFWLVIYLHASGGSNSGAHVSAYTPRVFVGRKKQEKRPHRAFVRALLRYPARHPQNAPVLLAYYSAFTSALSPIGSPSIAYEILRP